MSRFFPWQCYSFAIGFRTNIIHCFLVNNHLQPAFSCHRPFSMTSGKTVKGTWKIHHHISQRLSEDQLLQEDRHKGNQKLSPKMYYECLLRRVTSLPFHEEREGLNWQSWALIIRGTRQQLRVKY